MKRKMSSVVKVVTVMVAAVVLMLASGLPAYAAGGASENDWQYSLMPYLWLPTAEGNLRFSSPPGTDSRPEVETTGNRWPDDLSFVLMLKGEARKGDWAIFTDIIYLDVDGDEALVKSVNGPGGGQLAAVNANASYGLKGFSWQLAGSYMVARNELSTLEVLGGIRYFGLEGEVEWNTQSTIGLLPAAGHVSQREDLWDGIVGVRGKLGLGKNWFIPYYFDIGAGSSKLTWQGQGGLGYAFKWGDVLLAYRHLSYDQDDDKLYHNFSFSGPALGVNFRF